MPSSADPVDPVAYALNRAARWVLGAATAAAVRAPVVVIDGRSGSGKSSLARALVRDWPGHGAAQLVALDSFYPGWEGLAAGTAIVRDDILGPRSRGHAGRWRRWDWTRDEPAEEHLVDPTTALIVEGAGALTAATAAMAGIRVWLESPARSRRGRALGRDGETYRPHWDAWAEQERTHLRDNTPARWATHAFMVP